MRSIILWVFGFLVFGSATASAQDVQEICRKYANNAVAFQKRNIELGCGLAGPEWNDNFRYHRDGV